MSAADWFKMLLRRWYVIVPVLMITAAGCVLVARSVPATYEAQATVLLLQPPDPNVEGPQNPYLRFGGGLPVIADVLGQTMAGDQAQTTLASRGAAGTVTAASAPGRSPMVILTAEALTKAEAEHSLDIGIQTLVSILQDMQQEAKAPQVTWVSTQLVARANPEAPIRRAQIRAVIAVGAAGLVLSLAITLAFEALSRVRMQRPLPGHPSARPRNARAQVGSSGPPQTHADAALVPEATDEHVASKWM